MERIELPKILVGFSGNLEDTVFVDQHLLAEKCRIRNRYRGVGGTSVNVCLGLVSFGFYPTCLVTVGQDEEAKLLREKMSNQGLPFITSNCRTETSYAYVRIVENNLPGGFERTIDSQKTGYRDFPKDEVRQAVTRFTPDCAAATGCIAEEAPLIETLFDGTGIRVLNPRESLCVNHEVFHKMLAITDILCLNEGEFRAWLGKKVATNITSARQLLDYGPKIVVVTLAERGAVVVTRDGETVELSAYYCGKDMVDATGAGDAFLAGFLAAYLTGGSVFEAVKLATIVAGIKVTKIGGANVPTREQILAHYPGWSPWKFGAEKFGAQVRMDR